MYSEKERERRGNGNGKIQDKICKFYQLKQRKP